MTRIIDSLRVVAPDYDAIVFDHEGVLDEGAVDCLESLRGKVGMAVLSNSGKRVDSKINSLSKMGFDPSLFNIVMTSGEAFWREIEGGKIRERVFFAIERRPGSAKDWASGLDIKLSDKIEDAEAVLLTGIPDRSDTGIPAGSDSVAVWEEFLKKVFGFGLTIFCPNPDRGRPWGGRNVSPGKLAFDYRGMGGEVRFYGKPYRPVFDTVGKALDADKILMVGDSFEHDIAGAQAAGWDSLLIQRGIHAKAFAAGDPDRTLRDLAAENDCRPPTYRMEILA